MHLEGIRKASKHEKELWSTGRARAREAGKSDSAFSRTFVRGFYVSRLEIELTDDTMSDFEVQWYGLLIDERLVEIT